MPENPLVSLDTETWLIQPGLLAPPLVCVSFSDPSDNDAVIPRDEARPFVEKFLAENTVVGQNIAYDWGVVCAQWPDLIPAVFKAYEDGRIRDTMVRQHLLDIAAGRVQENGRSLVFRDGAWTRAGYALADLERLYSGKDRTAEKSDPNGWRKRYDQLDGVPLKHWPGDAYWYALDDAQGTLAVYLAQATPANEIEQVQAAWALHLMSAWGIRTDPVAVEKLETALLIEQAKNWELFLSHGFYVLEPLTAAERREGRVPDYILPAKKVGKPDRPAKWVRDTEVIAARVTQAYEGNPPHTEKGKISLSKDTLVESGDELLSLLADGGGNDKILTTYIPALKDGTKVPINARFNVLVNSGRTSCAEPNLQNLPTGRRVGGVRECFVPRDGHYFVSVDYDTLELRALAQVCLWLFGKSKMADAIRAGKDLHVEMAANMLQISYEAALARKKAGDPEIKKARDLAKIANFGYMGGLGAATFVDYARNSAAHIVITQKEAWELKQNWLRTWPEMVDYFAHISNLTNSGDTIIEQFVSKRKRGGVGFTDCANSYVQGLAADGAKAATFAVAKECYVDCGTALFGTRPVAFIHDEILAEVPMDNAHEASARLTEVMCLAMAKYIPDIPITASPALMRRWYKGAEAVYSDGKLVPWAPKAA